MPTRVTAYSSALRPRTFVAGLTLGVAAIALVFANALAAATVEVVKPSALNGWGFLSENTAGAVGSFVTGPGTAPLGTGSARMEVDSNEGLLLAKAAHQGTLLSAITDLSYSTYRSSLDAGNNLAASVQIGWDFNLTDATTGFQGRLVFEPYHGSPGLVAEDTWQNWNTMTSLSGWWLTPSALAADPGPDICTQAVPCTWTALGLAYPNGGIHAGAFGFVGFKAGSGPSVSMDGNVDNFVIGYGGNTWTYDFEPETQCTTTCYVDDSGNDAFGGDTPASAKKTIQAAIDQVSANGQVRVLPGTYDETATNRTVVSGGSPNGPHQFGLFFDNAKPGIDVIGVTAGDVAVTDGTATQATITTNATNNFGSSGIFVDAANITISGFEIGPNVSPPGDNKTIEVANDGFELRYSNTSIPGGGGSIYINDWSAAGNVVKAYNIHDNEFDDGTSVDISSGAGSTGPVSGRDIRDNNFDLQYSAFSFDFPAISFNGSGTTVPWFVNTVGGAEISGNSFSDGNQYIRSRGTVPGAEFPWGDWFNDNTFQTAVMTGPDPANDNVTGYTYSTSYTFPNTKRIGATIQGEVDHSAANDIVLVNEGDYTENVVATTSGLKFRGNQYQVAVGGRTFDAASESTLEGQFKLDAANMSVDGFSIQHHINADDANFGVWVTPNGGGASISNNYFKNIINAATTGGVASSQAVYLQNGPDNVSITDNKMTDISGFRSTKGIFIGDASSGGNSSNNVTIDGNVISSVTSGRGAYGILINNGNGTGSSNTGLVITDNNISGILSNGATGAGWAHAIGLEADTPSASVMKNVISNITDGHAPNNDQVAVYVGPNPSHASVNVERNDLAVGNDRHGIANTVASPAGNLDGTCNWWGDSAGPGSTNGSDVGGTVTVEPWLITSNLDGACTGVQRDITVSDPAGHNFGNQPVSSGPTAPFTFTVTNDGQTDLTMAAVLITGTHASHFAVDTNNCAGETLTPGESCTIDVVFDPASTGGKSATLNIASNDPDEANVTRALSGTGTAASPGTIIIRLDTLPNHKTDFQYSGDLGAFKLDDDANGTLPKQRTFASLAVGEYDITQATVNNFQLMSIACVSGGDWSSDINTRTLTIDLSSGETYDCTFYNARRIPDARIGTSASGPFKGNGVYSTAPGAPQKVKLNFSANQTKSFYFSLENDGTATDDFTVDGNTAGSSAYTVTFYNGATDITTAVMNGTYQVNDLVAGASVLIRAEVTSTGAAAGAKKDIDVYFTANGSTKTDVVRGTAKRP